MLEEPLSTEELLETWRDAALAAQLAERLSTKAAENAARTDHEALDAEAVADLAEQASHAAERAASSAHQYATRLRAAARDARDEQLRDDRGLSVVRRIETVAHDRYARRPDDHA
jgi:hypothetical protein